ncbi:MAG: molybdate ABC transporter substrate-binding protein [Croceibacterium sp.]
MLFRPIFTVRALVALLALTALGACYRAEPAPTTGPVVLAASSLQESLQEVATAWTGRDHPAPVLAFAATSALARQIEQGAPADLFVSADEEWADKLDRAHLLRAGTRRDVLTNELVLIGTKGGTVRGLADLGQGKLALADPAAVPAGKYARAALESSGAWAKVAGNVVPAENVRAALALVERGEAPLGVVYATDALASAKVDVLETFPAAGHPPIRYPVAIIARSKHPDAAGFSQFLSSLEAQAIFIRHGFGIAR